MLNEQEKALLKELIYLLEQGRDLRKTYDKLEPTDPVRMELMSSTLYKREDEIGHFIVANAESLGCILARQTNYLGVGQSAISKSGRMLKSLRHILHEGK